MRQSWSETFQAVGSAVLGLLKAELEALEAELARSGKSLGIGLGLLAAAAAVGFWTLGVATYFLIQLIAVWLPLWAASLIVTLAFAVLVAGLAIAGLRKLKRFENPVTTVRRRVEDHMDWWHGRVLGPHQEPRFEKGTPLRSRRHRDLGGDDGGVTP
jgi:hypothetical protein